jgi:hypothetical protein
MPISIACPACGATLKAPTQLVGKNIHCPKCGKGMVVHSVSNPTPNRASNAVPRESEPLYRLVDDKPEAAPRPRPTMRQPASVGFGETPVWPKNSNANYQEEESVFAPDLSE